MWYNFLANSHGKAVSSWVNSQGVETVLSFVLPQRALFADEKYPCDVQELTHVSFILNEPVYRVHHLNVAGIACNIAYQEIPRPLSY